MKIKGNWKGYYEYGQGYQLPEFGERVSMQISLEEIEDGFEGECIEEKSEYSIHENSKISGFVEDGMVSFNKKYENTYEIQEDGEVKIIDGKELEINYYGNYDSKYDCMIGIWEIESQEFEQNGETVIAIMGGIWRLDRVGESE